MNTMIMLIMIVLILISLNSLQVLFSRDKSIKLASFVMVVNQDSTLHMPTMT